MSELQINYFEFRMGTWRNNGNDIAVVGKKVRTFYSHCFSGSCSYCQEQILICYVFHFILFFCGGEILLFLQQIIPPFSLYFHWNAGVLWCSDVQSRSRVFWEPKARWPLGRNLFSLKRGQIEKGVGKEGPASSVLFAK